MTYRAVDVAGLTAVEPQDQALPILQWVELDSLVIDTRYQRELGAPGRKAIQTIADSFDWMQFSPVLIAPADGGRFAVIDGQHRVHAAKLCGFHQVPAQIVMASAAQQASAFVGVNGKVISITAHQVYRAALAAREGWALRCRDIVEAAGCTLATCNPSSKTKKPRVIYQIGTIRNMVVKLGQAEALRFVLSGLVAYDQKGRIALYTDYVVRVMVDAVHDQADLLDLDLAAFCAARDPFHVLDRVRKMRADGLAASYVLTMRSAMQKFGVTQ
jgi:hypothetical protein